MLRIPMTSKHRTDHLGLIHQMTRAATHSSQDHSRRLWHSRPDSRPGTWERSCSSRGFAHLSSRRWRASAPARWPRSRATFRPIVPVWKASVMLYTRYYDGSKDWVHIPPCPGSFGWRTGESQRLPEISGMCLRRWLKRQTWGRSQSSSSGTAKRLTWCRIPLQGLRAWARSSGCLLWSQSWWTTLVIRELLWIYMRRLTIQTKTGQWQKRHHRRWLEVDATLELAYCYLLRACGCIQAAGWSCLKAKGRR